MTSHEHDPNNYPQTHDPLGRQFSEPLPGGPVTGKLNLMFGVCSANGQIIVSLIHDNKSTELFVGGYDEHGQPKDVEGIDDVLSPLTDKMEPYAACAAYYDWYETYVGDMSFDDGLAEVERLLGEAGLDYELT